MKNLIKYMSRFFVGMFPKNHKKVIAYVDGHKTSTGIQPHSDDSVYLICERLKQQHPELEITYFFNKIAKLDPKLAKAYAWKQFLHSLRTYYIITADFPIKFYYTKKQKILITGYYTPFKADRFIEHYTEEKYGSNYNENYSKMCGYFDSYNYTYLVSSYYALNIISASMGIPARKIKVLGLARNELLLNDVNFDLKHIFSLSYNPKKVFLYAPTFRDYEFYQLDSYWNDKNIFGYTSSKVLTTFLQEHDVLILYKPHNFINGEKGNAIFNEHIKLVSDQIMAEHKFGSYELMKMADALICDYSSISFDYLYLQRPMIFNIPDFDLYNQYRGFPIANMKTLMAGAKTSKEIELVEAIKDILQGKDSYREQRSTIHSIVNEVPAEGTIDRIIEYFIERGC